MKSCDDVKPLLVGLLDRELTVDETREVNEHLIRCASCRAELERLREATGRLHAWSYQEPTDLVLSQVWKTPYSRFARNASLWMILAGYLLLVGYATYGFFVHGREPLPIKTGLAAILIGFGTLLCLTLRERFHTYKNDPYKDIQR